MGSVVVAVRTPGGAATDGSAYIYSPLASAPSFPLPTVTTISPSAGPTAGGSTVTLTGANFTGIPTVTFGGTPATGVTVISATEVTAVTPSEDAGAVDVAITTPGGTAIDTEAYTYAALPTLTTISPSAGRNTGYNTVTLTGANLTGTTSVTFGGTAATDVTVVSSTEVTAVTPAGGAGTVDVAITTPGGTAIDTEAYTYAAAPTITSISPTTGPTTGGTLVTIIGTNFLGATAVYFDYPAASFTVVSETEIQAVTTATGYVDGTYARVDAPGGTAYSPGGFTFENS